MTSEPLLLDTHVLLWYFGAEPRVRERSRGYLDRGIANSELFASAISLFEFGELIRIRRIAPFDIHSWVNRVADVGLNTLPLDAESAMEAGRLPGTPPADPYDRLLIGAARAHGITLATRDGEILDYGAAGNLKTLEI